MPVRFAPGVISTEAFEFTIAFSPDVSFLFSHRDGRMLWVSASVIEDPGERRQWLAPPLEKDRG